MASGIVEPSSQGSESEQEQSSQPHSGERSKLVQRLLDAGPNLPAFLTDLLTTQAVMVAGTEAAGFIIERQDADNFGLRPLAHIRPDESDANTRAAAIQAFQDLIKPCIAQGKDGAIEVGPPNHDNEPQYCLVTLLRADTQIVAASAVVTRALNTERARQRLTSMQLVAGYFELFSLRRQSEQNKVIAENHQDVLQLATSVATAEGFHSAGMNLCNELANRTAASRVSLGWLKGRNIKVQALSHTEDFDKKQELIVLLEKAMEECADQEQIVSFDSAGGPPAGTTSDNVTRSAAELSRKQGGHIVLSLPLRRHAEIVGIVTLEFLPAQRNNALMAQRLAVAVDLLGPQLYDRFQNDRWLITKTGLSARYFMEETLGPKHWTAKLIATGVILLLLILTNFFNLPTMVPGLAWADIRPMYRVSANFTFDAIEKRSIASPFDGYIEKIYKLPGDKVKAGDPLVALDTSDLIIKKAEADSERISHLRQADKYKGDGKIADQNVELAQAEKFKAQADAVQWQIDHALITAPFDGEILKGDRLDQRANTPVKQGDELMLVGNRDKLRADISVNERDIQAVKEGSHGYLATTSLPSQKHAFIVERILPIGQAKEGNNVFTVYGALDESGQGWRPGMAGEVRIDVQRRTWVWIWTHKLVEFVRLKLFQ